MALGKRKRVYGKLGTHARAFANTDMFFPDKPDMSQNTPPPVAVPAKAPQSQKEATTAMEPMESSVDDVVAITGMDRATAVRYLKVSNGGWRCWV